MLKTLLAKLLGQVQPLTNLQSNRATLPKQLPGNLGATGSPDAVKGYGNTPPGGLPQYHAVPFAHGNSTLTRAVSDAQALFFRPPR